MIVQKDIDRLSTEQKSDLHNTLENHLMAIGVLERYALTEDQKLIIDDRVEQYEEGNCKTITFDEFKERLRAKWPQSEPEKAPPKEVPKRLVSAVMKLPVQQKIELFDVLQEAADASFQQMLQRFNITEEEWDLMHEKMHIHFAARDKKEADKIRECKGLK